MQVLDGNGTSASKKEAGYHSQHKMQRNQENPASKHFKCFWRRFTFQQDGLVKVQITITKWVFLRPSLTFLEEHLGF